MDAIDADKTLSFANKIDETVISTTEWARHFGMRRSDCFQISLSRAVYWGVVASVLSAESPATSLILSCSWDTVDKPLFLIFDVNCFISWILTEESLTRYTMHLMTMDGDDSVYDITEDTWLHFAKLHSSFSSEVTGWPNNGVLNLNTVVLKA